MTPKGLTVLASMIQDEWDIKFSDGRRELWAMALEHIPDETIPKIMAEVTRICEFPPRPANICTAYAQLAVGDDDAEAQWEAVKRIGHGASLKESGLNTEGEIALAVATSQTGWWELEFTWSRSEQPVILGWRKNFFAAYQKAHGQDKREAQLGYDPAQPQIERRGSGLTPIGLVKIEGVK